MISTKGRYALRVMIDLAQNAGAVAVPLKDIAERQEISKKYLEIIVKDLVKGNLIKGSSGKGGGYKLCKKPSQYTIGEILEVTEGPFISVACRLPGAEKCHRAASCKTLPIWTEFDSVVHNFFFSKNLSDII